LTIETQYLKEILVKAQLEVPKGYKPYRVQSLLHFLLLRLLTDKLLHDLQLAFAASLEATRVMEDITLMTCKHYFVLDVMLATLRAGSSRSAITNNNKPCPSSWEASS
jgi:hypothetical protein